MIATTGAIAQNYSIYTFSGAGTPTGISATNAGLRYPSRVALDGNGNVYFTDSCCVYRVGSSDGMLTLLAGSGTSGFSGDGGPATDAQLDGPNGLALDSSGNVYVADTGNNRVRMISNGIITTVAGDGNDGFLRPGHGDNGPAVGAELFHPLGVAVDSAGNLFIADSLFNLIRKVSNGVITTVVGTGAQGSGGDGGPATAATLDYPEEVAVDKNGALYISTFNQIRKVSAGIIITIAGINASGGYGGDGAAAVNARLNHPQQIAVDSGGTVYFADLGNNRIRQISLSGIITTVVGNGSRGYSGDGGSAIAAQLNQAGGVAVGPAGQVVIADGGNGRVRAVASGVIETIAGNGSSALSGDGGSPLTAQSGFTTGIAADPDGVIYFADASNNVVRKIANGVITTIAGNGSAGYSGDSGPAINAQLNSPAGLAVDSHGDLYIADWLNNRIRKVSGGIITTIAGNGAAGFGGDGGPAVSAQLKRPLGVAVDSGGTVYVADTGNNALRRISSGTITTLASTLSAPGGVTVDQTGNVYIADTDNFRIVEFRNGGLTTVAGSGNQGFSGDGGPATAAQLSWPSAVFVDAAGSLYIVDNVNQRIRKVVNGTIGTIAGTGTYGFSGDNGPATNAQFNFANSSGIVVDAAGSVYVSDTFNNRIRLLVPSPSPIQPPALSESFNPAVVPLNGSTRLSFTITNPNASTLSGVAFVDPLPAGLALAAVPNLATTCPSSHVYAAAGSAALWVGALTLTGKGSCSISVDVTAVSAGTFANTTTPISSKEAGNGNPAVTSLSVGRLPQTITFDPIPVHTYGDSQFAVHVSATSGLPVALSVRSGPCTTFSGSAYVAITGAGTCSLAADQAGNSTWARASTVVQTVSIAKAAVSVRADDKSVQANCAFPSLTSSSTGYVGSDNFVTGTEILSTPATPASPPGTYPIVVSTGTLQSPNYTFVPVNGTLTITRQAGTAPIINVNGIVPVYGFQPQIQPGSWFSIYGCNLATTKAVWNGDFPTSLGGLSLTVNGKSAYLWFVSPTQINAQAPDDSPSYLEQVPVVISGPAGNATEYVSTVPASPAISLFGDGKHVAGEIATPDGSGSYGGGTYDLVGPPGSFPFSTRPVRAGETLVFYGVGFGPTTPSVPAGRLFSGVAPMITSPTVYIGGIKATVQFAGITLAGLYQFNVVVPSAISSGDQQLTVTIENNLLSAGAFVTVQ